MRLWKYVTRQIYIWILCSQTKYFETTGGQNFKADFGQSVLHLWLEVVYQPLRAPFHWKNNSLWHPTENYKHISMNGHCPVHVVGRIVVWIRGHHIVRVKKNLGVRKHSIRHRGRDWFVSLLKLAHTRAPGPTWPGPTHACGRWLASIYIQPGQGRMVIGWTVYLHACSLTQLNLLAHAAPSQPGPAGTELSRVSSEPGSALPRACGWPGPSSKAAYQSLHSCMRWAMYE
jgi:hypothetical protein